jgi:S1-C subfamily serine protease
MNLQINCPFCQMLLAIDPRFAGQQMQCPSCQQLFMVAPPPVPVVQARQVSAPPPQQRLAANPQPGRAPAPRTAPKSTAKTPEAAGGGGMAAAIMIGLVLLGVGVVGGGFYYLNSALKKRQLAEKGLGSEIKSQLEAKRAANAKVKEEEAAKRTAMLTALRKFLTETLCEGNDKVAGEIMREVEEVGKEADKLFADADSNNDPKDMGAFMAEKMEPRVSSNPVIFNWLGGRASPKQFCAMLFGQERETIKERGKVADFLMAGNYAGTGTGFYISRDGWLLTNQHVVKDATEVDVRGADGVIRKAVVVKTDPEGDVAVLKTKEPASKWLSLAGTEGAMGAAVFTVGFPDAAVQGVKPKFTDGRISSLSGIRDDPDNYQITVPVQPGNSGGALVDVKTGAVVGLVASVLRGRENVTYAVKSRVAMALLKTVPGYPSNTAIVLPANTEMEALAAEVGEATVLVMTPDK